MTNSELRAKWQQAVCERDARVYNRKENMLLGPVGLEEAVGIAHDDTRMLFWFVNALVERLSDDEANP